VISQFYTISARCAARRGHARRLGWTDATSTGDVVCATWPTCAATSWSRRCL